MEGERDGAMTEMRSELAIHLPGVRLHRDRAGALPPHAVGGYPPEQVALTVALHDTEGLLLAVVAANAPLSLAKARRALRRPELRRATLEETRAALPGIEPTAIPPFGALLGVRAVVDRRLLTYNRVVCGAGRPGTAQLVDAGDLVAIGAARVADLCTNPPHG
jgi:prolyl-tRNA editing enzyme YbaK/EbsC (Cys-tRNA(Pro) deacylase)